LPVNNEQEHFKLSFRHSALDAESLEKQGLIIRGIAGQARNDEATI
jgi:hypothetical protein